MNLKELNQQKCTVNDSARIIRTPLAGLDLLEQETVFNIQRVDKEGVNSKEVEVYSSDLTGITNLSKSELFTVTAITISDHEKANGKILILEGLLSKNALTIRKKKTVITEDERKRRSERAKAMFCKKTPLII